MQVPGFQAVTQFGVGPEGLRLAGALQPELRGVFVAERLQARQVGLAERRGMPHQQRLGGAAEDFHVADRLGLVQPAQGLR